MTQIINQKDIDWSRSLTRDRLFDAAICSLARTGERVLDLGCGSGDLLARLKKEKKIKELGIEIHSDHVADCLSRGLSVIQGDLEQTIIDFDADSFDLVIMNQIMLSVPNPLNLLEHVLRVGRRTVVTFPNFAYWRIRMQLLFRGRLPVNRDLPFEWYDTPNIRLATVDDFTGLCRKNRIMIEYSLFMRQGRDGRAGSILFRPNLRSSQVLFCLAKAP